MRYPHRIDIIQPAGGKTATGAPDTTPITLLANLYAKVSVLTGSERWAPEDLASSTDAVASLNYRASIKSNMRVKWNGDEFEIVRMIPNAKKTILNLGLKLYAK